MAVAVAVWSAAAHAAGTPVVAPPATKVALVIGNGAYDGAGRLISPTHDARLIGDTLQGLGFNTRVVYDLSRDEFNGAIDWLAAHARGAQVVVLYYAGHGFEGGGDNFLVPVKTGLPVSTMTRVQLLERAIRLQGALARVNAAHPGSFIVLVDACRVPSRGAATPSLKREAAARGELIAYSTAAQSAAYDSMRSFGTAVDDGPFAYYLSMYMKAPGATIKGALEQTQQQVSDITRGEQRPWIESGLIGDVTLAQDMSNMPPASPPTVVTAAAPNQRTRGSAATTASSTLPHAAPVDDAAASRADSWDGAEYRVTMAAHEASAADLRNLRARSQDPAALTTLGMMAAEGLGMKRDARAALAYYRRAAQANYPVAQTLLGEAYFEGKLTTRDLDEAEKWLARAASRDDTRAKLDLAQLRAERGQGDATGNWAEAASLMIDSLNRQTRRAAAANPP